MREHTITLRLDGRHLALEVNKAIRDAGLAARVTEADSVESLVEQAQRALLLSVRDDLNAETCRTCAEAFERITNAWTAYQSARKQFSF